MLQRNLTALAAVACLQTACAEPAPEQSPYYNPDVVASPLSSGGAGFDGGGGTSAVGSNGGAAPSAGNAGDSSVGNGQAGSGSTTAAGTAGMGTTDVGAAGEAPVTMEPDVPVAAAPSYAATVEPYFAANCTAGCHTSGSFGGSDGTSPESKFDLTTGDGFAQLTSASSEQVPGMALIGATPAESYLWHKLTGTFGDQGGSGEPMPYSGSIAAADLDAVKAWIEGGAAP